MLDILLRASLEGALLVAVVWLVVRALPGLSPSARAALWWCAAAKFVIALIWTVPIEIAVLPAQPAAPSVGVTRASGIGTIVASSIEGAAPETAAAPGIDWLALVFAVWCAGLVAAFALLVRRWRRTVGVIRRASPASAPVQSAIAALAARLALRRAPDARISSEVDTPLVAGFLHPGVLLPVRFMTLSPLQQRMALCHELTHIARRDLWLGCVPALAERLFFFHPLVHLAAREYVFWRESACDAAVIETLDAAPHEYGRLLLDLGIASPRASLAAAGASWSFSNLKRRIHMLGDLPRASRTSRLVAAGAVLLTLCASVPLRLVARTSAEGDAPQSVPPAAQAQAAQPAAPKAPAPPKPPREPVAVRAQDPESGDLNYVVLMAGKDGERVHISGSTSDIARARSFRRGNEPLLWFRDRRGEFVVRDASVLAQVEAIWKPVGELGVRQGRLGGEQGKLGSKMGELGAKQGLIGAEQGLIGAKQGALGAKQGALGAKQGALAAREWKASEAQRAEIEKAHRDLERDMRALDGEMKALDARMREFEKPMRELGAEMEALGTQMEALGRQMEQEAARARAELRALLDRAVASGAAQPVK